MILIFKCCFFNGIPVVMAIALCGGQPVNSGRAIVSFVNIRLLVLFLDASGSWKESVDVMAV